MSPQSYFNQVWCWSSMSPHKELLFNLPQPSMMQPGPVCDYCQLTPACLNPVCDVPIELSTYFNPTSVVLIQSVYVHKSYCQPASTQDDVKPVCVPILNQHHHCNNMSNLLWKAFSIPTWVSSQGVLKSLQLCLYLCHQFTSLCILSAILNSVELVVLWVCK